MRREASASKTRLRWLFGDQLGPHFLDTTRQPVLLIESRSVFERRVFHRQKAHLILSAMRHRAAELGKRCSYVRSRDLPGRTGRGRRSRSAWSSRRVGARCTSSTGSPPSAIWSGCRRADSPPRGPTSRAGPTAAGRRRLLMEDFYRDARRRLDVLMEGGEPVTGQWNYDADNREPPPEGVRPGSTCRSPGGPRRTRSTTRSGPTWTRGRPRASASSARTVPGASPRPARRRWRRWSTSSATGCRPSGRTRTRC